MKSRVLGRRRLAALLGLGMVFALGGRAHAQAANETATGCATPGAPVTAPHLYITVTGARRVAGNITFTLYGARPDAFLAHGGKIALVRVPLTATEAEGCFVVSGPGTYAVAVYHDENNNHHFDRTLVGLPAEGYGFSNNAPIFLAPPSFTSVAFAVHAGNNRIAIRLRY